MSELNAFFARASFIAVCVVALACSEDAAGRRTSGISGMSGIAGTAAGSGGANGSTGGVGGGDVGNAGTGGAGSGGTAGSAIDDDDLSVHVEDGKQLVVDVVTVACPGECVEVKAVAHGGVPDYHFTWEDGSTSPTRMLCPDEDSTHKVTVTDTARDNEEFSHAMETATADVDAHVLDCSTDPSPDAGTVDECDSNSECAAGQTCFEGVCVGEGGLRFSLTWNQDTDFDLFVRMPNRAEISYINVNGGGGMLDVDDCFGDCRIPGGPHVENIFFMEDPPHGTYTYWIVNSGLVTADAFKLEVSAAGVVQDTQMGNLAAFAGTSARYTFEY